MKDILGEYRGANLKQKREAALLTQEELAQKLGVKKLTVLQWENEQTKPSLKHLRVLKEYFEKSWR